MVAALIDTGAAQSAITREIAALIGLPVVGSCLVMGSGAASTADVFEAHLELWSQGPTLEAVIVEEKVRLATLLSPIVGFQMLLGMDILSKRKFEMTPDGVWKIETE